MSNFLDETRGRQFLTETPFDASHGAISGTPVDAVFDPYGRLVSHSGPLSFKGTVLIDAYNVYTATEDALSKRDVNFTSHWQQIPL
jgi:hypothetical protein